MLVALSGYALSIRSVAWVSWSFTSGSCSCHDLGTGSGANGSHPAVVKAAVTAAETDDISRVRRDNFMGITFGRLEVKMLNDEVLLASQDRPLIIVAWPPTTVVLLADGA